MRKTIQIGNLDFSMGDHDLERMFATYGGVHTAKVLTHRDTHLSTGVGLVEMESADDGDVAIEALNGRSHGGRVLTVCWSGDIPKADVTQSAMFGPMNLVDEDPRPPTEK